MKVRNRFRFRLRIGCRDGLMDMLRVRVRDRVQVKVRVRVRVGAGVGVSGRVPRQTALDMLHTRASQTSAGLGITPSTLRLPLLLLDPNATQGACADRNTNFREQIN